MPDLSYDVQIFQIYTYRGKRQNTYRVRWEVAKKRFSENLKSENHASNLHSELTLAARRGEAFRVDDGLPVSMARKAADIPWFTLASDYADMKWADSAATTRRTHAEALMTATLAMLSTTRGRPDDLTLRRALRRWAFNPVLRAGPDVPAEIQHALAWLQRSTKPVSTLRRDENVRALLSALRRNLDGTLAAASVANRKRRIINALLEYAVKERELLERNPIPAARKAASAPKTTMAIDRRRVLNPVQARSLFKAVEEQARSGPRLVAFFGCLYFAGLRPEEAVALRRRNLDLPVKGWGTIHLERSEPHAGREWTDSGKNRDLRPLKQRDEDEVRPVPCPPELTAMLHHHIKSFGISQDGRIFRGERNDNELPKLTIVRAWKRARTDTFTPEVAASPLGATPYDLRHAACSTWLNAGVPATTVADWAGHSVDVLLSTYARCIDGTTRTMQTMIDAALGTT